MLVKEYAELVGVTRHSVTMRLKENNPPKPVKSFKKYGNTYDMEIDTELLREEILKKQTKKQAV